MTTLIDRVLHRYGVPINELQAINYRHWLYIGIILSGFSAATFLPLAAWEIVTITPR